MKRIAILAISLFLICSAGFVYAAIKIGAVPAAVTITEDKGGKVAGGAWKSNTLKGKVHVLFYVDPDEADTNDHVGKALTDLKIDAKKFSSVAVINMAATWMPNWAIKNKLKEKQKEFPHTLYVMDKDKILVKKWALKDDASDVILFDQQGKLIWKHYGKVGPKKLKELLELVKKTAK